MAAPLGNQNAAKAKKWTAAIERALARKGGAVDSTGIAPTPEMKALDEIADRFIAAVAAGPSYEKGDPWPNVIAQFGDRIEGKPSQSLIHGGDPDNPVQVEKIVREVKKAE